MNCLALRFEDDIIVIDAGLMFPESELLGVDIVVPDISYLIENKKHVRAIVLTHGHEDHIGGLPWILNELKVPVYATEFTLAYVEDKLEEHGLLDEIELIEIAPKQKFTIGPFTVEPIRVTHSLVDCVALAIETPVGIVVYRYRGLQNRSGAAGRQGLRPAHLCRVRQARSAGAAARLDECRKTWLHAQRARRHSPARRSLYPNQEKAVLQLLFVVDLPHPHRHGAGAQARGRKVAVVGRSMVDSTEIAQDLGYIEIPPGLMINPGQIRDFPPEQMMVLISGTQGEPMSALSRAAVDNHKHAHVEPGDTVVLSSRIIPGNEKGIFRVIDHLSRRDANVIYDDGQHGLIYVSGHGSQEEMRLLINLVRPRFFIPVHGDYRFLRRHAQLAMETGAVEHAMVIEDGDVLELDKDDARKKDKVTAGRILIDSGSSIDVVEDLVIRDRRILSEDGVVLAVMAINKKTGKGEREPEVLMRGFGGADIMDEARETVLNTLHGLSAEQKSDYGMVNERVRVDLKRLIQKTTGRRPMIMPVILEIGKRYRR